MAKENLKKVNNVEVGQRIKLMRMNKGMMQSELAKKLEMSQTHMSNIERGHVGVTLENIVSMCAIFECNIDYLVFGKEPKTITDDTEWLRKYTVEDCLKALRILESIKK